MVKPGTSMGASGGWVSPHADEPSPSYSARPALASAVALEFGKVGTARAGVHPGSRSQREPLSGAKHYSRVIAYPRASLHAGTVQRAPEEEAMQIIETQELVPSCHRPEVVETSELQPTCHS